jgi:hypothetical protein
LVAERGRLNRKPAASTSAHWEREGVRIDWSENVYDSVAGMTDFEANLIRFRAEGRWGFGVLRPNGVVEFPLTDT